MQVCDQNLRSVPIDSIAPHPRNPREGDLPRIGESIGHNGFYGAVLVQESSGFIIAGSHRWQAAKKAGATEIPAIFVKVDDATAKAIEEERRICYVGITRAMDRLTVTRAESRMKWGKRRDAHPSRFLHEMQGREAGDELTDADDFASVEFDGEWGF